jgi:hypothetical protein
MEEAAHLTEVKHGHISDVVRAEVGKTTWFAVRKGNGPVKARQQVRRVNLVDAVMKHMTWGEAESTRLFRRRRSEFALAAFRCKANVFSKQQLDITQTLQAMQAVDASWSAMRAFRTLLRHFDVHLGLAPERAMKGHLKQFEVPMTTARLTLNAGGYEDDEDGSEGGGKTKKTTEALVATGSILETGARDLDARTQEGTFVLRSFPMDPKVHGRDVVHVVMIEDWGGQSGKLMFSIRDCTAPCSYRRCSLVASNEPLYGGNKPASDHNNYAAVFFLVDGYEDLANFAVVRVGRVDDRTAKHVLVPKQAVRQKEIPVLTVNNEEAVNFKKCACATGTASERAALRAEVECDSGVLVVNNSKALGVRAGELCFAFRGDPPAWHEGNVAVLEMEVYFSMDLLALAHGLGHGSTSHAICCWCNCDAAEHVKARQGKAVYELRTRASEAANLEDFNRRVQVAKDNRARGAKRGIKAPNNYKGVSAVSVFGVELDHIIMPYLHLILGLVNDCVRETRCTVISSGLVAPTLLQP